ncbi:DNA repair protein RAD50 [Carex littledalei]|uniref:DNA repair protein RAD50 n=1 Tax=Carex littledalei TaxID=544730 RepID=A0A833QM52_9POAL|nr:DNA repair protein RAD50 [Carex littledalei]
MLIKGIRSFDPENKHVITFFKPLTLIVGPNGAGKTTIIECLKLSCTGELPPNSRSGQSFIHDPKVAGETETKGQIKLRFKTAAGKDVLCTRSFQLTQKASKMEFKAIGSVLQTINPHTGQKVCLSYRCADMDGEIPSLMGVSKAILENVIFVHQEESNWPLQDPFTLKKKFDDIFSATKYTKALEAIKKLHKDQAQEIKTCKLELENLQTLKDAAFKLRDNISQDQKKSEALKAQMKDLEGIIVDTENKIFKTVTTLEKLRELQDQILIHSIARKTFFKLQQMQYAALAKENEVIQYTDEELKEWQTEFDERIALLEMKINKLEREMRDEETKSLSLSQSINDFTREIGKLQAEADAHMMSRHERDSAIGNIFRRHNLDSLPELPFTNEVAANLTNRIKARLMDLEKDLADKKEHADLDQRLTIENDELADWKRSFQQETETLLALNNRINEFIESKKLERLKDLQEKHSLSESQLQKSELRKQELNAELSKSNELMRNQDQLKRNIADNLSYRKTKSEVDQLTREFELLEEKAISFGTMSGREADLKRLYQEKDRLLSELNRCQGTLSVYQSNTSRHKVELKQPQYKDIEKRHSNQLIQLKTAEMANKDLDSYYNALDKALMRFHSMKMEEINKIIKELWQQTYRGQDIDNISIHSDSEGAGTRSYCYRVLMQTGDAELEMRGRCSAGQKVLASLIIRLALAETFCLNCGMLALDEPTTNLDGPNAENLAGALLRIMEDRKGQANFQLIVITHDERFAQLIGQRQHAEKYYRVIKDEHQHSIIEAQEIFD